MLQLLSNLLRVGGYERKDIEKSKMDEIQLLVNRQKKEVKDIEKIKMYEIMNLEKIANRQEQSNKERNIEH